MGRAVPGDQKRNAPASSRNAGAISGNIRIC